MSISMSTIIMYQYNTSYTGLTLGCKSKHRYVKIVESRSLHGICQNMSKLQLYHEMLRNKKI